MRRRLLFATLAVGLVGYSAGCGSGEPKNYEDCILQAMEGSGKSDVAARLIVTTCRAKFPLEPSSYSEGPALIFELDAAQREKLTGRAGLSFGTYYSGNLYNENEDVYVTHIQIVVVTTIGGKEVSHKYETGVSLPPLSTDTFSFNIIVGDDGADYRWNVISARGRAVE